MLKAPRFLACFLPVLALRSAPPAQPAELLNGHDLAGWEYVNPEKVAPDGVFHWTSEGALAVAGKPVGYLATTASYENYRFHAEWRWPANAAKNSNGGVLLHIATGPIDRNTWPKCFQVQGKLTRAGDLLPMAGATFAEKLSTPPDAKTPQLDRRAESSEKPLGEWNTCDIVCRGDTLEVTINGVAQNRVTHVAPAAGRVGFQLEGTPFELRNVRLEPLGK